MKKRQQEADDVYAAQWDDGRGSHHPDYDPYAQGDDVVKASRETEECYNAIVKNDIRKVYKKIDEGADVNFVFGKAYRCPEGYTLLMTAAHRRVPLRSTSLYHSECLAFTLCHGTVWPCSMQCMCLPQASHMTCAIMQHCKHIVVLISACSESKSRRFGLLFQFCIWMCAEAAMSAAKPC